MKMNTEEGIGKVIQLMLLNVNTLSPRHLFSASQPSFHGTYITFLKMSPNKFLSKLLLSDFYFCFHINKDNNWCKLLTEVSVQQIKMVYNSPSQSCLFKSMLETNLQIDVHIWFEEKLFYVKISKCYAKGSGCISTLELFYQELTGYICFQFLSLIDPPAFLAKNT